MKTRLLKFLIYMCVVTSSPLRASVTYSTSFESPEFATGAFPTTAYSDAPDSYWGAWGVTNVTSVQNSIAHSGSQSVLLSPALGNDNQSGFWTEHENSGTLVTISADVFLQSSSSPSSWQFASYDWTDTDWFFVGGFNIDGQNGHLQLITPGFPDTVPGIVARDTWNNFKTIYNTTSQTFDIYINNSLVAGNLPFLTSTPTVRGFQFDTWGRQGGPAVNDAAYFDDFSFEAVPEPMRGLMFMIGVCAIHWRRRRPVAGTR